MARRKPNSSAFSKVPGPSAAQEKSRLLNLPPEIRNRIYTYVFAGELRQWFCRSPKAKTDMGSKAMPPVIRVCKQIHAEATPIFYAETLFIFQYDTRFTQWTRAIGQERCHRLRSVYIKVPYACYRLHQEVATTPRHALEEYGREAQ